MRSESSSNVLQGCKCVENINVVQVGATRLILDSVDTSTDVFEEQLGNNALLIIHKYTATEAKWQRSNNFQVTIDELKAFLG